MPLPPEEGLEALVRRREAEARAASSAAVERILGIADPAERMRAYAEFRRGLEDGEALAAEADRRLVRSIQTEAAPAEGNRTMAATAWTTQRRRLVLLHTLRPIAAAGCAVAATLPFALAAWRWGWSFWDAASAFLTPGRPLAGVALALLAAGLLGRLVGGAGSLEGLGGLVLGAFAAGVVGLAVAVAAV